MSIREPAKAYKVTVEGLGFGARDVADCILHDSCYVPTDLVEGDGVISFYVFDDQLDGRNYAQHAQESLRRALVVFKNQYPASQWEVREVDYPHGDAPLTYRAISSWRDLQAILSVGLHNSVQVGGSAAIAYDFSDAMILVAHAGDRPVAWVALSQAMGSANGGSMTRPYSSASFTRAIGGATSHER